MFRRTSAVIVLVFSVSFLVTGTHSGADEGTNGSLVSYSFQTVGDFNQFIEDIDGDYEPREEAIEATVDSRMAWWALLLSGEAESGGSTPEMLEAQVERNRRVAEAYRDRLIELEQQFLAWKDHPKNSQQIKSSIGLANLVNLIIQKLAVEKRITGAMMAYYMAVKRDEYLDRVPMVMNDAGSMVGPYPDFEVGTEAASDAKKAIESRRNLLEVKIQHLLSGIYDRMSIFSEDVEEQLKQSYYFQIQNRYQCSGALVN